MAVTLDLVQEALVLKSWGLPVFPVTNKLPRCRWKHFQSRRPSDREIGRLFGQSGVDGIAVVPGPVSGGFAVRDFDTVGGYREWVAAHPDLARSAPTVRTRRGFHVWSRATRPSRPVYRRTPDGEFLSDGKHYAVVPPTRHPKGGEYAWVGGPPLGPSEFPLLDPFAAGFLVTSRSSAGEPRGHKAFCSSAPSSVPLFDPVAGHSAGAEGLSDGIREAVLRTLPTGPGERNGRLHDFARALRDQVRDDAPPGQLYDAVSYWWRCALRVIGTKDFETTLRDFRRAFAAARVPMSQSRPVRALRRGASCGTDSASRLLGACHALAAETGGAFFLSARTAAAATGVGKSQADRLLKRLVAGGALAVVKKGEPSATGRRGTTWYRVPDGGGP